MKNLKNIALIAMVAFSLTVKAQNRPRFNEGNQKLESARIGMITNRLDLTPEQATTFWPIYNEFENKKKIVKNELRKHLSESSSLVSTDEKIKAELNEMMALRQKEVDIDKEYLAKFMKVINPRQVSELYRTEQMFKQMLLRRMGERNELDTKGPKGPK
jgi:Spy/CpxP family protein refolding chaperone